MYQYFVRARITINDIHISLKAFQQNEEQRVKQNRTRDKTGQKYEFVSVHRCEAAVQEGVSLDKPLFP